MAEPVNVGSKQVEAYSLLLAIHRYAKWVSSLQSARPSSDSVADREIRMILTLRDEHFAVFSRQIEEFVAGHRQLKEALTGRQSFANSQVPGERDQLGRGARQIELLNRLVRAVEQILHPTRPPGARGRHP